MTEIPAETLVTVFGGSGFLGRHLLARLVRRPDATVHVLVRASSTARAVFGCAAATYQSTSTTPGVARKIARTSAASCSRRASPSPKPG